MCSPMPPVERLKVFSKLKEYKQSMSVIASRTGNKRTYAWTLPHQVSPAYRWSLSTSCDNGVFPSPPSLSAACRLGALSSCNVHTMVVSTANCDPPLRGRPSTTTSSLRPSATPGIARSISLRNTFVRTRPFASLQILVWRSRGRILCDPRAQAARRWPKTSRRRPHRQLRSDR